MEDQASVKRQPWQTDWHAVEMRERARATFELILTLAMGFALVLSLAGCAGTSYDPADARKQAAVMRAQIAPVAEALTLAKAYEPLVCATPQLAIYCSTLQDARNVAEPAYDAAERGIGLLELSGVVSDDVHKRLSAVTSQARSLGDAVKAAGEAIGNVLASSKAPSSGGDGVGPGDAQPAESPAGAAPAGAP